MDERPVIPRASRPFESPMTLAIRNGRVPVAAYPSLVAAATDVAEADPAQAVAADPSVIDAERHAAYGDGVKHEPTFSPADDGRKALTGDSVATSAVRQRTEARIGQERAVLPQKPGTAAGVALSASHHTGDPGESLRLGRLSRWQEQR